MGLGHCPAKWVQILYFPLHLELIAWATALWDPVSPASFTSPPWHHSLPCSPGSVHTQCLWFLQQTKLLPSSRVSAYTLPSAWNTLPCCLYQSNAHHHGSGLGSNVPLWEAFADSSPHSVKSPLIPFTALITMLTNKYSCHHFFSIIFSYQVENMGCACLVYEHFIAR